MWWKIQKKLDDEEKVVYSYGFEDKDQSGEIEYNKISNEFFFVKLANKDTKKCAERFLFRQLYNVIHEENCPDEKQIAIG